MGKKAAASKTLDSIDIGIPAKQRAAIAAALSHLLADTYTLYLTRTVAPQDLPNEVK